MAATKYRCGVKHTTPRYKIQQKKKNRLSDYYWITVDMLNSRHSHLSKYSTFALEECQGDEIVSDKQDRLF